MSKISLASNANGTGIFTLASPATNTNRTLTLPDSTGTLLDTNGGTITGTLTVTGVTTLGNGAVLGVPASGTATNLTGLPLTSGVTGTLPVANGGTNLTSFTSGGVVYASSAGVLATGSALTFDGAQVKVTANPPTLNFNSTVNNSARGLLFENSGTQFARMTANFNNGDFRFVSGESGQSGYFFMWVTDGTEGMRLTSTGLGIGTSSPTSLLSVGTLGTTAAPAIQIGSATNGTGSLYFGDGVSSATYRGYVEYTHSSDSLAIGTAGTERVVISSAGNLGLGVAPSAWSTGKGLEVGFAGSGVYSYSQTDTEFLSNAYYNSGYKFGGSGKAMMYAMGTAGSGIHSWYTSTASGTAGNAISFTQAMTLDASGNLGIGTTSPFYRLDVGATSDVAIAMGNSTSVTSGNRGTISMYNSANSTVGFIRFGAVTDNSGTDIQFAVRPAGGSLNSTAMKLDSSGNLGLGVTPSAWDTASFKAIQIGTGIGIGGLFARIDNTNQFNLGLNWRYDGGAAREYIASSFATNYEQANGQHAWYTAASGTAGDNISFTQAMTLDASGRLVIGSTTANAKLNVNTTTYTAVTNGEQVLIEGTTAWQQGLAFSMWNAGTYNSGYPSGYIGVPNTSGSLYISGGAAVVNDTGGGSWAKSLNSTSASFVVLGAGGTTFYGNSGLTANTAYTPTTRMILTSTGNLGLASAPSAFGATYKAFQPNGYAAYVGDGYYGRAEILNNAYASSINVFNYYDSNAAGRYSMQLGAHYWYSAPAGTAGDPITFTQAMALETNGNFMVGTASALSQAGRATFVGTGNGLVTQVGNSSTAYQSTNTSGTSAYYAAIFSNNGNTFSTCGTIQVSGTATSYNTSSDYRLKEDVQPMTGALAKVAQLKPVTYKWKSDGTDSEGFIAHELAEVCPQAVSGEKDALKEDGSIMPQGIDTSFLVATLTAAIQEQQALITQLTARITALETA